MEDSDKKVPDEPQAASSNQPEILEVKPEDISRAELEKFIHNLVVSFVLDETMDETRHEVGDVILDESILKVKEQRLEYTMEQIEKGQVLACKINGQIAAIIAWSDMFDLPDGRKVYTIMTACTLPGSAGQDYYKLLAEAAFRKIRSIAPDSPIYAMTRSERVKKFRRKLPGWREYNLHGSNLHPIVGTYLSKRTSEQIQREIAEG